MHIKGKKIRIIPAIALLNGLLILLFCYILNPAPSSRTRDEYPKPLCFSQNPPLMGGVLFSNKVQQFIADTDNIRKAALLKVFPVCSDERKKDLIFNYNIMIYQSIQMRTSAEFNGRLQI